MSTAHSRNMIRRRVWHDPQSPRVRELLGLNDLGMTLEEIGEWFGMTRERARQALALHGRRPKLPAGFILTSEAAKRLRVDRHRLIRFLREGEFQWRGHERIVPESLLPELKQRLKPKKTTCPECGKKFTTTLQQRVCKRDCSVNYNNRRHAEDSPYEPNGRRSERWLREVHSLNLASRNGQVDWIGLNDACAASGLSKMQVAWLRRRQLIRAKNHPTHKRNGVPHRLVARQDVLVAGRLYRKYGA